MPKHSRNSFNAWFGHFAATTARWTGSPLAFILAALTVVVWAVTGPLFGFSETWQLVINTGTTIVTFLMVFLIQATQNRDTESLQLKIDELIRALEGAHNAVLNLEEMEEEELDEIRAHYLHLAEAARNKLRERGFDPEELEATAKAGVKREGEQGVKE